MRRSFRKSIKAVSPVIATIIIVAVAIVMSIAVAYWMLGLATTFTRYEKLEYTAIYPTPKTGEWEIKIKVKNTGSATATINQILINGIPYKDIKVGSNLIIVNPDVANSPVSVNPGEESQEITLKLPEGSYGAGKFTSGVTIEITIQTAAGNQYPKTIVLP